MRIAQFDHDGSPGVGRVLDERRVVPLRVPAEMSGDEAVIALAMGDLAAEDAGEALIPQALAAPLRHPPSIRDFMLFEEHLANGLRPYGKKVPAAWYAAPAFYFTNPHTVLPPGATLEPPESEKLDYELEVAVVVGRPLRNPSRDEALAGIAGYALFNDLTLRDVQAGERPVGLGPAKSKDFASALGPWLVTPDEVPGDPARPDLEVSASVNGEQWSAGAVNTMYFDLAETITHAARDSWVLPGDVLGTGTVPTGCVLELTADGTREPYHWLRPGDEVVFDGGVLGRLGITVGDRRRG
ncbi:MAG TPA: fumarylacetoacetate hydrolase family protein [Amycolatopsis sp.]|nr:fumarylacetoacetate hydrolase family protein [Amycolatopsis sp.]